MKKIILPLFAATVLLTGVVACGGNSEKKAEEPKTDTTAVVPQNAQPETNSNTAAPATTAPASENASSLTTPPKTEVSVGSDGASVKTKEGVNVSVNSKEASIGSKKLNIKVSPEKKQ